MRAAALLIILIAASHAAPDIKRCSACEAVAAELSTRLANERPRNHLDVRHRLDKDGKRYGKVIDFKISELRAIELMDNVCYGMDKYQLEAIEGDAGSERWILSSQATNKGGENAEINTHMVKEQRRILRNSCSDIIGQWEDDLAHSIRDGEATAETIKEVLCTKLGGYCPAETAPRPADEL